MSDRLGGLLRRDSERTPHYALADLLVHGTITPIAQGGAHALVALGSGADQFENLLGFDVQSSSSSRVFDARFSGSQLNAGALLK
jgi:hypothetical protein